MKFKKLAWYIIDIEDIHNPVVFNKGFRSKGVANTVRYRIFDGTHFLIKQGYEVRAMGNVKTVKLPRSWMSISEKRVSSYRGKLRVKNNQALLRKYKSLLSLKGSQTRSEFLNQVSKVANF